MQWDSACLHHFRGINPTTDDKPKDLERNSSARQEQHLSVQWVTTMDCVLERTNDQSHLFSELRHWIKSLVWFLPATPRPANNAAFIVCTPKHLLCCTPHPKEDVRVSCPLYIRGGLGPIA